MPCAWLTWTDGQQAASADRLRAGIEGSGGGGQARIAMSRQRPGLRVRTDGWAGTSNPAAERLTSCILLAIVRINNRAQRTTFLVGVKFGRIYSQPGGVVSRRCGLSSKFFDHLL